MFIPPTTRNGVTLDRGSALLGGPSLTDRLAESVLQERVLEQIKERFRETELLEPGPQVEAEVLATIQRVVQAYRHEAAIAGTPGLDDPTGMERRLGERALRLGYLEPLLASAETEEIQVLGPRVRVFAHGRWHWVEHLVPEDAETLRLIRRIIAPLGHHIDEHSPEVESSLPDGSRLTAVIPPQTEQVTLVIRRYVVRHHRLADLGTLPPAAVELVRAYARSRASMLIAGPVASGKTTLLRCIIGAGDPERTICSIEDVRELALHKYMPAAIPEYARRDNVEGEGAITHRQLLRSALRLRPDALVVGEVRGPEALDFLLAASTGHECLGSIHADSPRGALRQLATFARLAPEGVKSEALLDMIADHFDLVIVCGRGPDGTRRVSHIFEVTGRGPDDVIEGTDLWALNERDELVSTGISPRRLARERRSRS
jgi:pilus assembly protein CpaF